MNISTGIGQEILPEGGGGGVLSEAPRGVAPWERAGTKAPGPNEPEALARAARYESQVAAERARQEAREERRRRRQEERARKRDAELVDTAKKMFWIGMAGLPLMWLVMLIYFWNEFRGKENNEVIKRYVSYGTALFVVYTTILIVWFIIFQVYKNTSLKALSILNVTSVLTSGAI